LIDINPGEDTVLLNPTDAEELGVRALNRVRVLKQGQALTALVETSDTFVCQGEIGILKRAGHAFDVKDGDEVKVVPTGTPASVEYIKKKMKGEELSGDEIRAIVKDMVEHKLSNVELTAYVVATQINEMNLREVKDLTMAMVDTGEVIKFDRKPVFDFHSIGGCPGNKVTLLVVPIVAASGLMIPKTCSRAISSACGTADIMEVLANVSLTTSQLKHIAEEVGGTIAWGGGVNIAPADDLIIRVEYPLSIDPYSQVMASVMAKKKAVSADYFLLDIPLGPETKVKDEALAKRYTRDFIALGEQVGIKVAVAVTFGGQPVGRSIGPALEAREALMALEGKEVSSSIIEKSTGLAGILLEMGGVAPHGGGKNKALEIIKRGLALKKLKEIIQAQGGDPEITSEKVKIGEHSMNIISREHGYASALHNKAFVKIARAAGAPHDKGAGMVIHRKIGAAVEVGDPLMTIYADHKGKLEDAWKLAQELKPIDIKGMILEHVRPDMPLSNWSAI